MVKEFKIFKDLSTTDIEKIVPFFNKRSYNRKQYLEFPGSSRDYIYLVKSGRIKISYLSPEGKEITVTILHPGELYSMHSEATATVIEAAEIWYLDSGDFKNILLQNPVLMANVIKILGAILKNTNDALLNLAFKEVNSRLASLLLKMARDKGAFTSEGVIFDLDLTHEEMAKLISSSRQTVTTVLHRLEKMEVIELRKRKILVKNMEELTAISN